MQQYNLERGRSLKEAFGASLQDSKLQIIPVAASSRWTDLVVEPEQEEAEDPAVVTVLPTKELPVSPRKRIPSSNKPKMESLTEGTQEPKKQRTATARSGDLPPKAASHVQPNRSLPAAFSSPSVPSRNFSAPMASTAPRKSTPASAAPPPSSKWANLLQKSGLNAVDDESEEESDANPNAPPDTYQIVHEEDAL